MDKKDLKELKEKARRILVEFDKTIREIGEWMTVDVKGTLEDNLIKTNDKERINELIKRWESLTYDFKEYLR
jgi:hypothetical protein